jgi:YfiH family protein
MRSSDLVLNFAEGLRWVSFPPLDASSSVLHGLLIKDQNIPPGIRTKEAEGFLHKIDSPERRLISLSQTHRDECVVVISGDQLKGRYEGDALLTNRDDIFISVGVADCVPIFLLEEKKRVVGLIHAGWRGTLLGIARRSIQRAKQQFGCDPHCFTAAFGPCIQKCCYQISKDVAILFDRECISQTKGRKATLDLICANVKQLVNCGVKEDRIFFTDRCTFCDAESFYSYRREGEGAGRMLGFMGLR